MPVFQNWSRNIRRVAGVPQHMRLRDVSFSSGANRHAADTAKAAVNVDDVAVDNHGGVGFAFKLIGCVPLLSPVDRIQSDDPFWNWQDQLHVAIGRSDQIRCRVSQLRFSIKLPLNLSVVFGDRQDFAALLDRIQDQTVFEKYGARRRSPSRLVNLVIDLLLPQFVSIKVEREHSKLAEENVNRHSVRHRRVGRVAMVSDETFVGILVFDFGAVE